MRAWILVGVPFVGVMLVQACSSGGGGGGGASCADGGQCPSGTVCNTQTFICETPSGSGGSGGGTGGSAGGGLGGSGGGLGGSGGAGSLCETSCNKELTASCPTMPTLQECIAQCESAKSQFPSCSSQFDTALSCFIANGTPGCDADGKPELQAPSGTCGPALDAYGACITSGSGGSGGGSGGFGGSGGGFGGSGGGSGGSSGAPGDCETCIGTYCQQESNNCFQNADCAAILDCYNACTTQTCADACPSQYPAGAPAFSAFLQCAATNCSVQCS